MLETGGVILLVPLTSRKINKKRRNQEKIKPSRNYRQYLYQKAEERSEESEKSFLQIL